MTKSNLDQHSSLLELLDAEINLTESDHARNASSAWAATVFASVGLLAVGTQVPDGLLVRVLAVPVLVAVSLAALMFIGMQFGKRWSCAETSDVLRTLRSIFRTGGMELTEDDLDVPSGSIYPSFIRRRLRSDEKIQRDRRRAVGSAIVSVIAPWKWSAIDARARSEAACYVAVVVSAIISIVAAVR